MTRMLRIDDGRSIFVNANYEREKRLSDSEKSNVIWVSCVGVG
jgi:hypothetical protein